MSQPTLDTAWLRLDQIDRSSNIRTDLDLDEDFVESVRAEGVLVNCVVRPLADDKREETSADYLLVAGHRRCAALEQVAGSDALVPCSIIEGDRATDLVFAYTENNQREPLPPLDEAELFRELQVTHRWKSTEIAASLGVTTDRIKRRLKLLRLHDEWKQRVREGNVTLAAAELLAEQPKIVQAQALEYKHQPVSTWVIDRAQREVEQQQLVAAKIEELVAQGIDNVARRRPSGATQVVPSDQHLHNVSAIHVDVPFAQLARQADITVVVTVVGGEVRNDCYTSEPETYEPGGARAELRRTPEASDVEGPEDWRSSRFERLDTLCEHRGEFLVRRLSKPSESKPEQTRAVMRGVVQRVRDFEMLARVIGLPATTDVEAAGDDPFATELAWKHAVLADMEAWTDAALTKYAFAATVLADVSTYGETPSNKLLALGYEPMDDDEAEAVAQEQAAEQAQQADEAAWTELIKHVPAQVSDDDRLQQAVREHLEELADVMEASELDVEMITEDFAHDLAENMGLLADDEEGVA